MIPPDFEDNDMMWRDFNNFVCFTIDLAREAAWFRSRIVYRSSSHS
jgi:hypothetical protein